MDSYQIFIIGLAVGFLAVISPAVVLGIVADCRRAERRRRENENYCRRLKLCSASQSTTN